MSTRIADIKIPKKLPPEFGSGKLLPEFFKNILSYTTSRIEAPPFYESVTMRYWGSGTRELAITEGTITDTISYDVSKTFSRVDMRSDAVYFSTYRSSDGSYDYFDPQVGGAVGTVGLPALGCYIGMQSGWADRLLQLPYLARHYLLLKYYDEIEDQVVGTRAVDYDDPEIEDTSDDLLSFITFDPPLWDYIGGAGPADYGSPYDEWLVPFGPDFFNFPSEGIPLDISSINWRDLRATFVGTVNDSDIDDSWDTNDVVHRVSIEIS